MWIFLWEVRGGEERGRLLGGLKAALLCFFAYWLTFLLRGPQYLCCAFLSMQSSIHLSIYASVLFHPLTSHHVLDRAARGGILVTWWSFLAGEFLVGHSFIHSFWLVPPISWIHGFLSYVKKENVNVNFLLAGEGGVRGGWREVYKGCFACLLLSFLSSYIFTFVFLYCIYPFADCI